MITRLYADNFKTLVNFELPLGPMNLLLGANGAGKSTVLEVIRILKQFVCDGDEAAELFPSDTLCRWDSRKTQLFEISLNGKDGPYSYKLEVEHYSERFGCSVKSEQLTFGNKTLLVSNAGQGQFHRENSILDFSVRMDRSVISIFHDDAILSEFQRLLSHIWSIQVTPDIYLQSETEDIFPNADMSNFADWYRHLTLEQPDHVFSLTEVLKKEVLDGFRSLRLKAVGEKARALYVEFTSQAGDAAAEKIIEYHFSELSDGQRILIALYALAICAADHDNTLCLDHPESHLALPEIQPWLMRLSDATDDGRCQAIIATHHPQIINLLASHSGYWLERQSGGPTRVKKITQDEQDSSGLSLAELIARGWLYE